MTKYMFYVFAAPFIGAYQILSLVCPPIGAAIAWLWRCAFGSKDYLPSGERIITYDDGKQFIELTHKDAPSRRVPDTPELRARLMENHRKKGLLRFFRW